MDAESNKLLAVKVKKKTGCPLGTIKGPKAKLTKALVSTNPAIEAVKNNFEQMNDKDRGLFVSMTSGNDELVSLLKVGHTHGLTTIAKIVYTKEGKTRRTDELTAENVKELDDFSYERMLRIAKSEVRNIVGKTDYHAFITDITDLFKLIAPEQLAVLAEISGKKSAKDSDRIKAATSILDRAGYEAGVIIKNEKDGPKNPVQVNIVIGGTPKAEFNPILEARQIEMEEENENS